MNEPRYVGIDVAKDTLDISVRPHGQPEQIAHCETEIDGLVQRLRDLAPALIVLEATGGLEIPLAAALAVAGLPTAIVNPDRCRCSRQQRQKRRLLGVFP
jgi:transposase